MSSGSFPVGLLQAAIDTMTTNVAALTSADLLAVRQLASVVIDGSAAAKQLIWTPSLTTRVTDVFWEYLSGSVLTIAIGKCGNDVGASNVVAAQVLASLGSNSLLSLASTLVAPRALLAAGTGFYAQMATPTLTASSIRLVVMGCGG